LPRPLAAGAPIINDPAQFRKEVRQPLHLIKNCQMANLGLEECRGIFQFAAIRYAFQVQVQIQCAFRSIRNFSG
jgi:hypothetical protein